MFFFLLYFGHLSMLFCGSLKKLHFKAEVYFRALVCLSPFWVVTAALSADPLTPCVLGREGCYPLSAMFPSRFCNKVKDGTSHVGHPRAEKL